MDYYLELWTISCQNRTLFAVEITFSCFVEVVDGGTDIFVLPGEVLWTEACGFCVLIWRYFLWLSVKKHLSVCVWVACWEQQGFDTGNDVRGKSTRGMQVADKILTVTYCRELISFSVWWIGMDSNYLNWELRTQYWLNCKEDHYS